MVTNGYKYLQIIVNELLLIFACCVALKQNTEKYGVVRKNNR